MINHIMPSKLRTSNRFRKQTVMTSMNIFCLRNTRIKTKRVSLVLLLHSRSDCCWPSSCPRGNRRVVTDDVVKSSIHAITATDSGPALLRRVCPHTGFGIGFEPELKTVDDENDSNRWPKDYGKPLNREPSISSGDNNHNNRLFALRRIVFSCEDDGGAICSRGRGCPSVVLCI